MQHPLRSGAARDPRPGAAGIGRDDFARRFQEAAPVLWTIAAGILSDRGRAEDALQEACMIALEKLDRFDPSTSFAAWMGAFVRNVARNDARKGSRRATRPTDPDVLADAVPDAAAGRSAGPADPVDERGELAPDRGAFDDAVEAALRDLRPIHRAALLLRTVRELEYKEIALVLGIPEGTAMSHVHRARQALRRRLADPEPAPRGLSRAWSAPSTFGEGA